MIQFNKLKENDEMISFIFKKHLYFLKGFINGVTELNKM